MTAKKELPRVMYHRHNNEWHVSRPMQGSATLELPPKTFMLTVEEKKGFFLVDHDDFQVPTKLYGEANGRAQRIMKSFEAYDKNMGVLAVGRKGSGKTLLLKQVSKLGREMGMPTIIIPFGFIGQAFRDFMVAIDQPCVVAVDEVDKTYYNPAESNMEARLAPQNELLPLLSGLSDGKKLYFFTANEIEKVSPYLINRSSRIRYTYHYSGLDDKAILGYARDHLDDKSDAMIAEVMCVARTAEEFNLDLLQTIIQDANLHKESVFKAASHILSTMTTHYHAKYVLSIFKDGKMIEQRKSSNAGMGTRLFNDRVEFQDEKDELRVIHLRHAHFVEHGTDDPSDCIYARDGYTFQYLVVPNMSSHLFEDFDMSNERHRLWEELMALDLVETEKDDYARTVVRIKEDKEGKKPSFYTPSRSSAGRRTNVVNAEPRMVTGDATDTSSVGRGFTAPGVSILEEDGSTSWIQRGAKIQNSGVSGAHGTERSDEAQRDPSPGGDLPF